MTSTNGLPDTKLMVSAPPALPSKGVESLVDLRDDDVTELFSTEGDVSLEKENYDFDEFQIFFP